MFVHHALPSEPLVCAMVSATLQTDCTALQFHVTIPSVQTYLENSGNPSVPDDKKIESPEAFEEHVNLTFDNGAASYTSLAGVIRLCRCCPEVRISCV